jgi:hypothetical protein
MDIFSVMGKMMDVGEGEDIVVCDEEGVVTGFFVTGVFVDGAFFRGVFLGFGDAFAFLFFFFGFFFPGDALDACADCAASKGEAQRLTKRISMKKYKGFEVCVKIIYLLV